MEYKFKPLQWIRNIRTGSKPKLSIGNIKDGFAPLLSDGKETNVRLMVWSEEDFKRVKELERGLIEKSQKNP